MGCSQSATKNVSEEPQILTRNKGPADELSLVNLSGIIQPTAGFVVKCKVQNGEKLFLNILHSTIIESFVSTRSDTSSLAKYLIFNVIIPTNLFHKCEADSLVKNEIAIQSLDHISLHYNVEVNPVEFIYLRCKQGFVNAEYFSNRTA